MEALQLVFSVKNSLKITAVPQDLLHQKVTGPAAISGYIVMFMHFCITRNSIIFSMWQVIFGPNFRLIDQHLVLVWADLYLFLATLQQYFGEVISDQTCNAPNAPKIFSLIIIICMKLNLGFRLAIL